jgi:hypothetical protein
LIAPSPRFNFELPATFSEYLVTRKPFDRERLKERWRDAQELSGGPFRLSGINRHIQFSTLHAAAKARVSGNLETARAALSRSKAARTDQWINRLSPMALIERAKKRAAEPP